MRLTLKRIAKRNEYTIGKLFVDGVYFCDVLEDIDRGLTDKMAVEEIERRKIAGRTAIPTGIYSVTLEIRSPKFAQPKYKKQYGFCNAYLPRLINVKGYSGVLIHCGNTHTDTEGCLLCGENKAVGKVLNSTATFKRLYEVLKQAKDPITIEIK